MRGPPVCLRDLTAEKRLAMEILARSRTASAQRVERASRGEMPPSIAAALGVRVRDKTSCICLMQMDDGTGERGQGKAVIVGLVGGQLVRAATRPARRPAGRWDGIQAGGQHPAVMPVGRAEGQAERRVCESPGRGCWPFQVAPPLRDPLCRVTLADAAQGAGA